ncbi:MAG: imelysin family protein [Luteibaculum sp.]
MKKAVWIRLAGFCTLLALFAACTEEQRPEPVNTNCSTDVLQVQSAYRIYAQQEFSTAINAVQLAQQAFQDLNNNPELSKLATAKQSFYQAYLDYQRLPSFDLGIGYTQRPTPFFDEWLNPFPTNADSLNKRVSQNNPGATNLSNGGKAVLGFPALEYLLHAFTNTESAFIDSLNANNNLGELILAEYAYILESLQEMQDFWNGSASDFISNQSGVAEGDPLPLIINAFVKDFEYTKNVKLKAPAGRYNLGDPQPQLAEAKYMDKTLELAEVRYEFNKMLFYANQNQGLSLADYVSCVAGQDLVNSINSQFAVIDSKWLDESFNTVVENQSLLDQLNELINEMQKMTPPLKAQMTSALNIRITYQDNDGD